MSSVLRNFLILRPKLFQFMIFKPYASSKEHKKNQENEGKQVNIHTAEEWENAKPYWKIPGPSRLSLLRSFLPGGELYDLAQVDMHKRFRQKYGSIMKLPSIFGRPEILFTYIPEDFEKVFRTEGPLPERRPLYTFDYFRKKIRPEVYQGYGGLVNDQGETWAKLRSKVNPILLKPHIIRHHLPEVDEIARIFLKRIKSILDPVTNETPSNFGMEASNWTLECTAVFALNRHLGLINNTNPDGEVLMKTVKDFFQLAYELDILPSIWMYYKTPKFNKLMDALDVMTDINIKYIKEALHKFEDKKLKDPNYEPQGALEKLVVVDEVAAIVMAMDMLIAGIDTTSSTFLGLLYRLAKTQEAQEKLRQEVMAVLPEKDSMLTVEKMTRLPYLKACIKETLRLTPITPGTARAVGQDLILGGYQIPKGTCVMLSGMVLTTDEKYFPRTEEFLPERWLRNDSSDGYPSARDVNPFVFLPFGFGVRMCVGRRIAEFTIEVMMCRLIRNFRVFWDHSDMKYQSNLVIRPTGDLKFRFEEVSD